MGRRRCWGRGAEAAAARIEQEKTRQAEALARAQRYEAHDQHVFSGLTSELRTLSVKPATPSWELVNLPSPHSGPPPATFRF